MKIINPLGKTVNFNEGMSIQPRGCKCSHGAQSTRSNADGCSVCKCQCDHGDANRQANYGHATAVVRY